MSGPTDKTEHMSTPEVAIRFYQPGDYEALARLYDETGWLDKETDAEERILRKVNKDPESLLVACQEDRITGSVSILEDGRVAWFFRLIAIPELQEQVIPELIKAAGKLLRSRGYHEALVYSLSDDVKRHEIYRNTGFTDGRDFHCSWINLQTLESDT